MGNKTMKVCPICGKHYRGHPAISRIDNETPICPECGTRQALASIGITTEEQNKIIKSIPNVEEDK